MKVSCHSCVSIYLHLLFIIKCLESRFLQYIDTFDCFWQCYCKLISAKMLNLKLIALTKDGAPEIFKFSFGETCWHTVYTTSIFSMKVAKTLPYMCSSCLHLFKLQHFKAICQRKRICKKLQLAYRSYNMRTFKLL